MRCPGCQIEIDESAHDRCPFCAASLRAAAQPTPPASALPCSPRTFASPPPLVSLPVADGGMARMERNVYRALVGGAALLGLLTIVGVVAMVRHYSRQQAAFEKEARFDLSTPEAAASEAVRAVKGQAWARLYYICEFSDRSFKLPTDAVAYAKGFHASELKDPEDAQAFRQVWGSVTDIRIGRASIHGDRAEVPIDASAVIGGVRRPTHGIAHLVNLDGSWRLDMTSVSIEKPTQEGGERFGRVLLELLATSPEGDGAQQAGARGGIVPFGAAPRQMPSDEPSADSYVTLQSDEGDFIGGGRSYRYTPADSRLSVAVSEGHLAINVSGREQWTGDFCCPGGQLRAGTFTGLPRFGFSDNRVGGMDWGGDGRGSNTLVGSFAVSNLTIHGGVLMSVDVRFEQHSEGAAAALRGTIHWRRAR